MSPAPYSPPPPEPLDYLHVDASMLVVVKPGGLLSVPGRGPEKADCLVSRVQADFPDALIVHRLDMETSGLIVLARNTVAHRRLSVMFQEREVHKRYLAVVSGLLASDEATLDYPLIADWPNRPLQKVDFDLGKPSTTHYRVLARDASAHLTRVELTPITGRTHQLRVHMLTLGHPILGDALYGTPETDKAGRLLLHASSLELQHPDNGRLLSFSSEPPF
ncbi:MAG: RNA pseudouridine synthase [Betaproteobacteria bacterium HGW-Betaproteobacteria-13]|nr:MAG: RNA pseudouridine synthase [Betaproteobacteria bacterium HGW-Betaproteobacteria-21]PKO81314.1 MAG: RNA pseudouridine synthase [Betaproteobacteria bacterium HGW-Betaproteobacteria-13]